ncbi:MAG: four helix bundle protein [Candidatus Omnitrophica bacterium]|nr:four helix bundle protein [Candidatus Omnitrophota bacterium]
MQVTSFTDLRVWQKAHQLTIEIYKATQAFPQTEMFGLVSQIRRSAVSVCANIAEGQRKRTKDFARYLEISQASLQETKYHLILSKDLGYISRVHFDKLFGEAEEIGKMIHGLRNRILK